MNYLTMLMYQNQYRTIRTPLYEAGYDDYEYGEFDKEKDDYDMSL